jgi:predicted transcriptional regulator
MYAGERIFRPRQRPSNRVARTEARILEMFRSMLATRPFGDVAVAEIADRCGIARSTFYRRFATTTELLWALTLPLFERALEQALRADHRGFGATCAQLWAMPGIVPALTDRRCRKIRQKLATLSAASLEKVRRNRGAQAGGAIIAGAWFGLLDDFSEAADAPAAEFGELMTVIYVAAYLTPSGMRALASAHAREAPAFPAAVSARESLSSDDYIVSMIDGKPYRLLTRHIARYGLTPADYRRCFFLPDNYPMAAKSYSERRRTVARKAGPADQEPATTR